MKKIQLGFILIWLLSPFSLFAQEKPYTIFVIDASGSMNRKIEGRTMLSIAKKETAAIVGDLPGEVGLVVYGHRSETDCTDIETLVPLSAEGPAQVKGKVGKISAKGKTPIGASLEQAGGLLISKPGPKRIILLSDGEETCARNPVEVARDLAAKGIDLNIHVIGFAVTSGQAKELMAIAEAGKGKYFEAKNATGLKSALQEAKKAAVTIKKVETAHLLDTFNGNRPMGHWKILHEDVERWKMGDATVEEEGTTPAFVVMTRERGTEKNEPVVKNILELIKPLPAGDFEVFVWARVRIADRQRVVVGLWENPTKVLELQYTGTQPYGMAKVWRIFTFEKTLGDTVTKPKFIEEQGSTIGKKGPAEKIEDVYFKVRKEKEYYKLFGSFDGQTWIQIGKESFFKFNPKLYLAAFNPDNTTKDGFGPLYTATEQPVYFKKIEIKEIETIREVK